MYYILWRHVSTRINICKHSTRLSDRTCQFVIPLRYMSFALTLTVLEKGRGTMLDSLGTSHLLSIRIMTLSLIHI